MTSVIYTGRIEDIKSVEEVIQKISNNPKNNSPEEYDLRFYYRGQSNIDYEICPSIDRYKQGIGVESSLIEAANNKMPMEFHIKDDLMTTLAKMQHYGLPTRLIDFSTNPLVALYFACQNNTVDGEVIEINEHIYQKGIVVEGHGHLLLKMEEYTTKPDLNDDRVISFHFFNPKLIKEMTLDLIKLVPPKGLLVSNFIRTIEKEEWFRSRLSEQEFFNFSDNEKERIVVALLRSPVMVEAQEQILRQRLQQGKYLLIPNKVEETVEGYVIKKELPALYKTSCGRWRIKADKKNRNT